MEEPSPFAHDQRHAVQPFSVGPQSCLGRHLAWAEMRLILARLVCIFDVDSTGKSLHWADLKTFLLVEKKPVEVRISMRKTW